MHAFVSIIIIIIIIIVVIEIDAASDLQGHRIHAIVGNILNYTSIELSKAITDIQSCIH